MMAQICSCISGLKILIDQHLKTIHKTPSLSYYLGCTVKWPVCQLKPDRSTIILRMNKLGIIFAAT